MIARRTIAVLSLLAACASPAHEAPGDARDPAPPPELALDRPAPVLSAALANDAPPELTWSDARRRLLATSPDLEVAQARIAAARASVRSARAERGPRLDLASELLAAEAPSSYLFETIDAHGLPAATDFNDPGSFAAAELGVALLWNLYDGGGRSARLRAARANAVAVDVEERIVREALLLALSEAWIAVRASEAHIESAAVSVRSVEAQRDEVRARFDAGRALRSDLLSLEVRLAEAREVLIRARSARRLAIAACAQLLGFEPTELVGEGPTPQALPEDVESAMARAREDRAELALVRRRIEAAEAELDAARASRAPRADVTARLWSVETDGGDDDANPNWLVGLRLGLPLLDAGRITAAADVARAGLLQARRFSERVERDVDHAVRRAWLRLHEARTRAEVAAAAAEQAAETLELVRLQYEAGSAPITRYLEAELMWTDARRRRTDAGFDIRRAELAAAHSLGWMHREPSKHGEPR